MRPGRLAVEIAVQDLGGVRVALGEGADRVELGSALETGGLTPSAAAIERAVALAAERGRLEFVHVLIRSRPGDFVYTDDEVAVMRRDIELARQAGAAGVVIGALTEDSAIDDDTVARLCEAAGDVQVTFHRAVDVVPEPLVDVARLSAAGVGRILTSGGAKRVGEGLAGIREFADSGELEVMAGGGLTLPDVAAVAGTGAAAVHLSARRVVTGGPVGLGGGAADWTEIGAAVVRAAADTELSRR